MNLVIDAGNTFIKLGVFKNNDLVLKKTFNKQGFLTQIESVFKQYPNINAAIVSSVTNLSERYYKALAVFCKVYKVSAKTNIPFINKYNTKTTLGTDRMCLVTAAYYKYSQTNVLIISAGTCVTYDFLSENGAYLGGAISPGLTMRYKALNQFTANLPLLEPEQISFLIGDSTQNSIHSGVVNGITNEIDATISQYKARYKDLTVILTGGDTDFLSKRLKNTIFAHSNFLLEGLNYILEYNKR